MSDIQCFSCVNILRVVGALVLLAASASAQELAAIKVSLCSVASNPQQYNNKMISVLGQYKTDGIEHEALFDHHCNNTGFGLMVSGDAQGVQELQTALQSGYRGTRDKIINGRFIGIFQWKPGEHPSLILTVRRLQDITVVQKRPKSESKPSVGEQVLPRESSHANPSKPQ